MCWKPAMGRGFAVRSYYQVLTKSFDQSFPCKTVWKPKVPSRVAFFVWIVVLGNILTIDNLRKRKILFLDWYCMCKRNGESVDHLLIHCSFASDLWSSVYLVWQSLCQAEDSGGVVGLLARKVWATLKQCYLDGCPSLFDVAH